MPSSPAPQAPLPPATHNPSVAVLWILQHGHSVLPGEGHTIQHSRDTPAPALPCNQGEMLRRFLTGGWGRGAKCGPAAGCRAGMWDFIFHQEDLNVIYIITMALKQRSGARGALQIPAHTAFAEEHSTEHSWRCSCSSTLLSLQSSTDLVHFISAADQDSEPSWLHHHSVPRPSRSSVKLARGDGLAEGLVRF